MEPCARARRAQRFQVPLCALICRCYGASAASGDDIEEDTAARLERHVVHGRRPREASSLAQVRFLALWRRRRQRGEKKGLLNGQCSRVRSLGRRGRGVGAGECLTKHGSLHG
jgi:hypothetical protein